MNESVFVTLSNIVAITTVPVDSINTGDESIDSENLLEHVSAAVLARESYYWNQPPQSSTARGGEKLIVTRCESPCVFKQSLSEFGTGKGLCDSVTDPSLSSMSVRQHLSGL
ncbi:hypothetical protein Tco_1040824 [Tanacetum coccineum]|uniref:Uncharacterized protein n=1 Tax=Tanacetum coccineum TaxID=301880 RepID=A0ABQ5GFA3_9ASTR